MKYLNKNIEEIGKRTNDKSLVEPSTSCGIFQKYNYTNITIMNHSVGNKTY